MTLLTFFFYAFATLTLGGAVVAITRRSAVHSAISLMVSLSGVAGLYLLLTAEFLFVAQIIVYIGGILLLFLFVIMLVNLDAAQSLRQFNHQWKVGIAASVAAGGALLLLLFRGAPTLPEPPALTSSEGNTEQIADVLFQDFLVPFEVASLLLLVAVVGSVMMARKRA